MGIAWLVVAIIILTTDVKGSASISLVAALFVLWAIMLAEYLVRLVITPDSRGYLRRRWAEPVTVVVPVFQGWHLIGIEKTSLLLHEGRLRLEAILKHHSLFRVLIAACATLLTGSWLVLLFEENAKGSNIHSYPEALWWAIVTVDHRWLRGPVPGLGGRQGRGHGPHVDGHRPDRSPDRHGGVGASSRSIPTPTRKPSRKAMLISASSSRSSATASPMSSDGSAPLRPRWLRSMPPQTCESCRQRTGRTR